MHLRAIYSVFPFAIFLRETPSEPQAKTPALSGLLEIAFVKLFASLSSCAVFEKPSRPGVEPFAKLGPADLHCPMARSCTAKRRKVKNGVLSISPLQSQRAPFVRLRLRSRIQYRTQLNPCIRRIKINSGLMSANSNIQRNKHFIGFRNLRVSYRNRTVSPVCDGRQVK